MRISTLFQLCLLPLAVGLWANPVRLPDGRLFIDAEATLIARHGALDRLSPAALSAELVALAESLPRGGAIHLPISHPCGDLDFRQVADDVQITGGWDGRLILGGGQQGLRLYFVGLELVVEPGLPRLPELTRPTPPAGQRSPWLAAADARPLHVFEDRAPASDLIGVMCKGGLKFKNPVSNLAWIAGANAFGPRTIIAEAPVNNSLFLWFGTNWTFSDYNAHLNPAKTGKDWLRDNAQMWFNCQGGGQGTRLYLMVETNYGNPGPGVVLENCRGMSLYHGATERGSAQGPGIYWLKDCEDMKVGLRRIFPGTRGAPKAAIPTHDITIEGGKNNILHVFAGFGNSYGASLVNRSAGLQLWAVSMDYETTGTDQPDVLKYAFTPFCNQPEGEEAAKIAAEADAKAKTILDGRAKEHKTQFSDAQVAELARLIRTGREAWTRINGRHEQTLKLGSTDLLAGPAALPAGQRLPPPPSMPATDAPATRAEIAFTQVPEFGQELLAAGADPTGAKPSDDAFAQVLYGLPAVQVAQHFAAIQASFKEVRAARVAGDKDAEVAAMTKGKEAHAALLAKLPVDKNGKRVKQPPLHVPAGTFKLTQPLLLLSRGSLWGAGPERTIFKVEGDIVGLKQVERGTLANFSVVGGRTGLAITGADHSESAPPGATSYIAGTDYYKLRFQGQSFAGIHIGEDDIGLEGGAEFDQNKFLDMEFDHTGDYGIYMNTGMLDKWLLLNSHFVGQRRAGVSIKFNNLIHGGVVACTFRDINGPGLDFFGGNPRYLFRPYVVMVEQCQFIECGNAESPAVDQGYGELMSFTRCRIITENKTIHTGYMGSAQHYEDVEVRVKVAEGAPAMILRGVRQGSTARANGHILRGVRANGPLAFINDANAQAEHFRRTLVEKLQRPPEANWDINPAAHELAPANGWVHPFLLYDCQFGDQRVGYSLLNVDTTGGKVLARVDYEAPRP